MQKIPKIIMVYLKNEDGTNSNFYLEFDFKKEYTTRNANVSFQSIFSF